jgi:hypothetical protein
MRWNAAFCAIHFLYSFHSALSPFGRSFLGFAHRVQGDRHAPFTSHSELGNSAGIFSTRPGSRKSTRSLTICEINLIKE